MKDPIKKLEGMVHKIPEGVPLKKVSKKKAEATRQKLIKLEEKALLKDKPSIFSTESQEAKAILKELERETKKAKKSTMTVTADNSEQLKWIESNSEFIPTSERTYSFKKVSWVHKTLALLAIAISLGLMVAGIKVVLETADKTGIAVLVTILLGYTIAINIRRFK